jgi:hypothetical protein
MADFIKGLLQREPARFVSYATVGVVWVLVKGSALVGYPIAADSDVALAVATIVGFFVTEAIRYVVYAPATVAEIVAQIPPGAKAETAAAVMEGAPPAVQPKDLPGGGA